MKIPEEIKNVAKELISMYGEKFKYLGMYRGEAAYMFVFPDDSVTGFPFIYLYKDGKAVEISGFDSLDILDSFDIE